MKQRICYLDVAKALGMFVVYFSHYGPQGGYGHSFAFYSIPLFFFVSGWTDEMMGEMKTREYLLKKVRTILAPYFLFAAFSIGIIVLEMNALGAVQEWCFQVMQGCIRNTFFAGTLWFLSCLFVISVIFAFVRKIKFKSGIVLVGALFYVLAAGFLPNRPAYSPSWVWNIDSAMEYIIYYAFGYVSAPIIMKLMGSSKKKDIIIKNVIAFIAMIYSAAVFVEHDLLEFLLKSKAGVAFHDLIGNTLVILCWLTVSCILQDVKLLQEIGKNTLFLCGSEWIIKEVANNIAGLCGIEIAFSTPLSIYVFSFLLLVVGVKCFVPVEKMILKRLGIL